MKYLLFLFLMLILVFPVFAQEEDELDVQNLYEMSLEELMNLTITSASKTEKSALDVSVSAAIITQADIERRGYQDLLDVLSDLPGVHLVRLSISENSATEVFVRGIQANRKLMILVDGHKINPPTGEGFTFVNNIPLIAVKQVEFTYGSSSSLYGSDAMAGIVNIVTFSGSEMNKIRYIGNIGNYNTYQSAFYLGRQINEDLSFSVSGKLHFSDVENFPKNYPNEYKGFDVDLSEKSHNLHAKIEYKKTSFSYYRVFSKRNSAYSFFPSIFDYSGLGKLETTNQFFVFEHLIDFSEQLSSKSIVSYNRTELDPKSTYVILSFFSGGSSPQKTVTYYYWLGNSTKFEEEILYKKNRLKWISGGSVEFFNSTPKTIGLLSPLNIDNSFIDPISKGDIPFGINTLVYHNIGLFTQIEYAPNSIFEFTAGLRYDENSRFAGQWNPRFGILAKPVKQLNVKAAYGSSYLAPPPGLAYETYGRLAQGAVMGIPNPELKAENLSTYEFSVDASPTSDLFVKAAAFYMKADDIIRSKNIGQTVIQDTTIIALINDNLAESKIWGFEFLSTYKLQNFLYLTASYTFTAGEQSSTLFPDSLNVDLTHMPKHLVKASLCFSYRDINLNFSGNYFDGIKSSEGNVKYAGKKINDALIFNCFANYRIKVSDWKFDLGIAVNNIFDKKYYIVTLMDEVPYSMPEAPQPTRIIRGTLKVHL